MTTRRGAKGKFSIPSNFGFRRHRRDKKIKKYTYIHIYIKGEENFGRNSMAVSKTRVAAKLPFLSISILDTILPSSLVGLRAVSRVNEAKEEEGGGRNILVSPRMVIHRDNLSGKLHRGWLRLDEFVTRFWNSTRWFVRSSSSSSSSSVVRFD